MNKQKYSFQKYRKCPWIIGVGGDGFELLELTGGLYFGERSTVEENGIKKATDTLTSAPILYHLLRTQNSLAD